MLSLDEVDTTLIRGLVDEMTHEGVAMLRRNGVPAGAIRVDLAADMRYRGQTSEIQVWLPLDAAAVTAGGGPDERPADTIAFDLTVDASLNVVLRRMRA